MIYLLDLNYTLVGNSEIKLKPFTMQIENETYRQDLIEKIKNDHVILVTARPEMHQASTIDSLVKKTGWVPNDFYFNKGLPPPAWKNVCLKKYIFPKYGKDSEYLAIESNPRTRAMYDTHGIKAIPYEEFINDTED